LVSYFPFGVAARFITPFDSFGFGAGGTLDIRATIDVDETEATAGFGLEQDKIAIFICPQKHYSILVTDSSSPTKICGDESNPKVPTSAECKVAPVDGNVTHMDFAVPDVYRFCVVNCMRTTTANPYVWLNMSYTGMSHLFIHSK